MDFSSSTAMGKLDWQLVLLGRAELGVKGQGERSGVDPPGEDEGKRKGGEESDMGGRDLEHWHMEMEEREGREGGEGEGRKVTRSDREREGGMRERWRKGWAEQGMLLIHRFDLADGLRSQLVCVHVRVHTCLHAYVCVCVSVRTRERVWASCALFARRGHSNTNPHKQVHPLHHREISHLSDLSYNQQINDQNILLGWLVIVSVKGSNYVSTVKAPLSLIGCKRKKQTCLLAQLLTLFLCSFNMKFQLSISGENVCIYMCVYM